MGKIFIFVENANLNAGLHRVQKAGFSDFSYLALKNLSQSEVALLHAKQGKRVVRVFSEAERDSFLNESLELVGQMNHDLHGLLWWATDIASKNRFMSPLTSLLEKFWIAREVIWKSHVECLVILGVPRPIYSSLCQLANSEVRENSFDEFVLRLFSRGKTFIAKIVSLAWNCFQTTHRIFLARKFFGIYLKKDPFLKSDYTVLKSFVYQSSFSKTGDFQDPYFGDLPQKLNSQKPLIILATILVDYEKCLQAMKDCSSNLILPWELFLSFGDPWIWSLRYLFYRPRISQKMMLGRTDVTEILKNIFVLTGPKIQLAQLFCYPAVRRFADKVKVRQWIMTYENNPWERMCLWALRENSPETKISGYVQSVVPQASTNMFLSSIEKTITPLPDQILTTGEESKKIMEKYGNYEKNRIRAWCGLRFEYLFRNPISPRRKPIKRVLLALEGIPAVSAMVTYVLKELGRDPHYEVIIRTHPVLPWSYFEKRDKIVLDAAKSIRLSQHASLADDLRAADLVVYWGTTVALEALSLGKPVIHFDQGSLLSYDPLFCCQALKWTVSEGVSLAEKCREIDAVPDDVFEVRQREARDYLRNYFAPVTEDALSCLT